MPRNLSLTSLRLTIHVVTLQRLAAAYRAWLSASLALRWRRALVLHSDRHVRRRTFRRWHSRTRAVAGDAVRRELADCSWRARRLRAAWRRADDHVRARHLDARVMARGRRFPLAGALARWRAARVAWRCARQTAALERLAALAALLSWRRRARLLVASHRVPRNRLARQLQGWCRRAAALADCAALLERAAVRWSVAARADAWRRWRARNAAAERVANRARRVAASVARAVAAGAWCAWRAEAAAAAAVAAASARVRRRRAADAVGRWRRAHAARRRLAAAGWRCAHVARPLRARGMLAGGLRAWRAAARARRLGRRFADGGARLRAARLRRALARFAAAAAADTATRWMLARRTRTLRDQRRAARRGAAFAWWARLRLRRGRAWQLALTSRAYARRRRCDGALRRWAAAARAAAAAARIAPLLVGADVPRARARGERRRRRLAAVGRRAARARLRPPLRCRAPAVVGDAARARRLPSGRPPPPPRSPFVAAAARVLSPLVDPPAPTPPPAPPLPFALDALLDRIVVARHAIEPLASPPLRAADFC